MSSVNGLELVTPEAAGYEKRSRSGAHIEAIVLRNGNVIGFLGTWGGAPTSCTDASTLIPLPKPKALRPYVRGEVRCGDVFRKVSTGEDVMVLVTYNTEVRTAWGDIGYGDLLKLYQKLTYDPSGKEVIGPAGIEE